MFISFLSVLAAKILVSTVLYDSVNLTSSLARESILSSLMIGPYGGLKHMTTLSLLKGTRIENEVTTLKEGRLI